MFWDGRFAEKTPVFVSLSSVEEVDPEIGGGRYGSAHVAWEAGGAAADSALPGWAVVYYPRPTPLWEEKRKGEE